MIQVSRWPLSDLQRWRRTRQGGNKRRETQCQRQQQQQQVLAGCAVTLCWPVRSVLLFVRCPAGPASQVRSPDEVVGAEAGLVQVCAAGADPEEELASVVGSQGDLECHLSALGVGGCSSRMQGPTAHTVRAWRGRKRHQQQSLQCSSMPGRVCPPSTAMQAAAHSAAGRTLDGGGTGNKVAVCALEWVTAHACVQHQWQRAAEHSVSRSVGR